eukprot:2362734-Heterocapsa_arctica.AAC.1
MADDMMRGACCAHPIHGFGQGLREDLVQVARRLGQAFEQFLDAAEDVDLLLCEAEHEALRRNAFRTELPQDPGEEVVEQRLRNSCREAREGGFARRPTGAEAEEHALNQTYRLHGCHGAPPSGEELLLLQPQNREICARQHRALVDGHCRCFRLRRNLGKTFLPVHEGSVGERPPVSSGQKAREIHHKGAIYLAAVNKARQQVAVAGAQFVDWGRCGASAAALNVKVVAGVACRKRGLRS